MSNLDTTSEGLGMRSGAGPVPDTKSAVDGVWTVRKELPIWLAVICGLGLLVFLLSGQFFYLNLLTVALLFGGIVKIAAPLLVVRSQRPDVTKSLFCDGVSKSQNEPQVYLLIVHTPKVFGVGAEITWTSSKYQRRTMPDVAPLSITKRHVT